MPKSPTTHKRTASKILLQLDHPKPRTHRTFPRNPRPAGKPNQAAGNFDRSPQEDASENFILSPQLNEKCSLAPTNSSHSKTTGLAAHSTKAHNLSTQMGRCGGGEQVDEKGGGGDQRASERFESVQRRKNRSLYTTAATFAAATSKARRLASEGKKEPRGRKNPLAEPIRRGRSGPLDLGIGGLTEEGGATCGSNRMRLLSRS